VPTCFVIMPFGSYFDGYYANVMRPAILAVGLSCVRADEIYGTGAIVDDIYRAIQSADICVADVTGRNPNVSYELGMAHALGKPVLLLTQSIADVPFDYRHLRLISYDPKQFGWENAFGRMIEQTLTTTLRNPTSHLALKAVVTSADTMRAHLQGIFYATAYDLDRTNRIYCERDGRCVIKTTWKGIAKSPIFHLCHNIVADRPGTIEVRTIYDKLNARKLEHVVVESGPALFTYFLLFKQFKSIEQSFEVETEVRVDGYLDVERLLATREALVSTQAVAGGIRYICKSDWLYLPKIPELATVYAEYLSHPRRQLVGTQVLPVETPDHYLLKMVFDADAPYQQETATTLGIA
jgi:hypothetical protein